MESTYIDYQKLQSYKDLEVWKRSLTLVKNVYIIARELPKFEQFGLTSQIQRSAVSIPSNIAEGYARKGTGDYIRFLSIAYGSAAELETQLIIINQEYSEILTENAQKCLVEVQKMLYSLMAKLSAKS
jgi:four helix bundle protein